MRSPESIAVDVVYAEPDRAVTRTYRVGQLATVADVLREAAADPAFATIDFPRAGIGIFGRPAAPDQGLQDGDRVEIYRPLAADPKIARRNRVSAARKGRRS